MVTDIAGRGPLCGRDGELARAGEVLRAGRRGVVLVGPPGMGKTRLASELLVRAAADGWPTASARASEVALGIPLGAFAPLLPEEVLASDNHLFMLMAARKALVARGDGQRLVLVVDDLHLLDDTSALLVAQVLDGGEVALIATQRSGELAPEPVARLIRERVLERFDIGPLAREEAIELVTSLAGAEPSAEAAERLWDLTAGNPLFLRELVLAARDAGTLVPGQVGWHLSDEALRAGRLADLVTERVARLSEPARDALAHVTLGEPLGIAVLEAVVEQSSLDELVRSGIVSINADGYRTEVVLSHPLHGEVLRNRLGVLQTRRVLRRLAEALTAFGANRGEDRMRLATWALDSGAPVPDELLVSAARQALFSNEWELAARLAGTAFDRSPTFASGHILSDALYELGRAEENDRVATRLVELAEGDEQRALAAMALAINAFWRQGDAARAHGVLVALVDSLEPSPWRDEATALRATLFAMAGRPTDALAMAEPLLTGEPGRAAVQAAVAAVFAYRSAGRAQDALDLADAAIAIASSLGEQMTLIGALAFGVSRSAALNDLGRMEEAIEAAESVRATAASVGDTGNHAIGGLALGLALLSQGKPRSAIAVYEASARACRRGGHPGMERWCLIGVLLCGLQAGDEAAAARAEDRLKAIGDHPARVFDVMLARAEARRALDDADPERARAIALAAVEDARRRGAYGDEAAMLARLARLGRAPQVAARMRELAPLLQGARYAMQVRATLALADEDGPALEAVAADVERAGGVADAAALYVDAAAALAKAGDQRAAARAAQRAKLLHDQCEHAAALPTGAVALPDPLTPREREIAQLAAAGLASKTIGERLFVSSRTVDNHLARVYDKLGVRSRGDLADALAGG